MKKVIPDALHGDFFVENRYTLVQGHKKKDPLSKVRGPSLTPPTSQ